MSLAASLAGILLSAASVPPVPATPSAAGSVRLPALAHGEVLAQVSGFGVARTNADHVVLTLHPVGTGASRAEARRAVDAIVARLTARLREAGVPAGDIDVRPVASVNEDLRTFDVEGPLPADAGLPPPEPFEAHETIVAVVRDLTRLAKLQGVLTGGLAGTVHTPPRYALDDDRALRREALDRAMAVARLHADAYAAALGMRVGRVLRVSDRVGFDFSTMMMAEEVGRERSRAAGPAAALVERAAYLAVDYVLVPR